MDNLNPDTPEWLVALMKGGLRALRKWIKTASIDEMRDAAEHFFVHSEERKFIQEEIQVRQQIEIDRRLSDLRKPHWTIIWTFWLVVATLIVSILAWWFPHLPS